MKNSVLQGVEMDGSFDVHSQTFWKFLYCYQLNFIHQSIDL